RARIGEVDGSVALVRRDDGAVKVKVTSRDVFDTTYAIPSKFAVLVTDGQDASEAGELMRGVDENGNEVSIRTKYAGLVKVGAKEITVRTSDGDTREDPIPPYG